MKKKKTIIGSLALVFAVGSAFAIHGKKIECGLPGELYYFNSANRCVKSPCTTNPTSTVICKYATYYDINCTRPVDENIYCTVGK